MSGSKSGETIYNDRYITIVICLEYIYKINDRYIKLKNEVELNKLKADKIILFSQSIL